jgi:alanine-glyoxylate transaminase/serine-glyoxylate transaminase/serine-pyruvate transaminase
MEKVLSREEPVRSWYLDLSLLQEYWGEERAYHHTAPITNIYALREGLRLVAEEGIEQRWDRHLQVAGALKAGVEAMGLELNPEEDWWLPSLNAVRLPEGVDDWAVIDYLLEEYGIEVASGLGALSGEILRIGCMGHSARPGNVLTLVGALGTALEEQGADVAPRAGFEAANEALR